MSNNETKTLKWDDLCEDIQDSCSWSIKANAWKFHPKTQAIATLYEDERKMLSDAARWFGFNSITDACH